MMQHWISLGFVREMDQLVSLARAAEELGFHGVTVADHLAMPTHIGSAYPYSADKRPFWPLDTPWPDPWVTIGAMGAVTTKLRFATNVYLMALREPFQAARSIGTAAVLTGNRVACGVAEGWLEEEYAAAGVHFRTRGRRLDEAIAIVSRLLEGAPFAHEGEHFRFEEVLLQPAPTARVPIWGGGVSPRALRRVATMCSGWLGLAYAPDTLRPVLGRLTELRAEAGRGDEPFDVLVGLTVRPTPDVLAELESLGVTGVINTPWLFAREDISSFAAKRRILEKYAKAVLGAAS